jgi:hypothetical protein
MWLARIELGTCRIEVRRVSAALTCSVAYYAYKYLKCSSYPMHFSQEPLQKKLGFYVLGSERIRVKSLLGCDLGEVLTLFTAFVSSLR